MTMTAIRKQLNNRRYSETLAFEHGQHRFHVTAGYFADGSVGEVFVNTSQKAGSEADINASDAAVAVSLALQYGCPLQTLREAMKRNADGTPQGPLAAALDTIGA